MKKTITLLFAFFTLANFAQTTYDFEVERDDTNTDLFTVYAIPSADATGANFTAASIILFISTGQTVGTITSLTGTGWANQGTISGADLQSLAGIGDGTKDFIPISSSGTDNVIFDHTAGTRFALVSFIIENSPTTGNIEFLSNTDQVVTDLNNLGFNVANAILINAQDGNGGGDSFGDLIGTTSFDFAPLSIDDFKLNAVSAYPNPVKNTFKLELANNTIDKATIYNINGRIIKNIDPKSTLENIDISYLNTGVYFLQVKSDNAQKTIKIIKQ